MGKTPREMLRRPDFSNSSGGLCARALYDQFRITCFTER